MKSSVNKTSFFSVFSTIKAFVIVTLASIPLISLAQEKSSPPKDDTGFLNSFIQAKGYEKTITFTPENIKQFWTDHSVFCKNDLINIILKEQSSLSVRESVPFNIKLVNVDVAQDCRIDVISDKMNISFNVLDNNQKAIAASTEEDKFINYNISTALFHLEETTDFSFYLKFITREGLEEIKINKIILSFSDNKSYLVSPGVIKITPDNSSTPPKTSKNDDGSFVVTDKKTKVVSSSKILVFDNTLSNSATIKNIGNVPTNIYMGYYPETKDGNRINNTNNPYKGNNKILNVISSEKGSNIIIVDAYSDWTKGCSLALNAKEDLSDYPNCSLVEGKIQEVNKIDDDHVEIVFDKTFEKAIPAGTQVRIQSPNGAAGLYTHRHVLQPGEEITLSGDIKKDDDFFEYSPKAFSKGCFYVIPFIFSWTKDSDEENTVLIKDFTVSY